MVFNLSQLDVISLKRTLKGIHNQFIKSATTCSNSKQKVNHGGQEVSQGSMTIYQFKARNKGTRTIDIVLVTLLLTLKIYFPPGHFMIWELFRNPRCIYEPAKHLSSCFLAKLESP